jgi:hypothetical protein
MQARASTFIHILAFQCPQCQKPILEWKLSPMRSPESIDGATFSLKCSCGWSDGWLGAQARRHLVQSWSASDARLVDREAREAPGCPEQALDDEKKTEEDTLNTL